MLEFRELLDALGAETRLDTSAATAAGGCTLQFDGDLEVTFELAPGGRAAQLFSALMTIAPDGGREAVLAGVLQLHLFGMATQDCYFGLDPQQDRILLFRTLDLELHDSASALKAVEVFVNQAERWKGALPELARRTAPQDGAGGAVHAPHLFPSV